MTDHQFTSEHEYLEWKRAERERIGEWPEITIVCTDKGRHREKRLGTGGRRGLAPSRAGSGALPDNTYRHDDGTVTTTLDPCPVCGKRLTLNTNKWLPLYAALTSIGQTKLDMSRLPF